MPTIAVSSWSVRHALGPMYPGLALTAGARRSDNTFGAGSLTLLDFPDAARAAGINQLDLCHFHFPRTDADYLREFSERMAAAEVQLLTLLVDEGDISALDPAARENDLARIRDWIDIASWLGARYVRVVAGEQAAGPGDDAVKRSAEGLSALAHHAQQRSVGLLTENWRALTMSPDNLLAILDATGGAVGLVADFGNYKGASEVRRAPVHPTARDDHPRPCDGGMGAAGSDRRRRSPALPRPRADGRIRGCLCTDLRRRPLGRRMAWDHADGVNRPGILLISSDQAPLSPHGGGGAGGGGVQP